MSQAMHPEDVQVIEEAVDPRIMVHEPHGFVRLVDWAGDELSIVNAARVSFHKESDWEGLEPLDSPDAYEHLDEVPVRGYLSEEDRGLIRYLLKHKHGTPFEHAFLAQFHIRVPIFVMREWVRHRVGFCLAGDTEIWTETISPNSGRTVRKRPIADLYQNWHEGVKDSLGRVRLLPSCRNLSARVLNEDTRLFELGEMTDIVKSGIKSLLLIQTTDGHRIECSKDHQFLTQRGWVKAEELKTDTDLVAVVGKRNKNKRTVSEDLRSAIGRWTTQQRERLIGPSDFCYICEEEFSRHDLVLDHVIPVIVDLTKGLDEENLKPICRPCHREKTNGEQSVSREIVAGSKYVNIRSIDLAKTKETYDISMSAPWHNFVANGFVVHNSINEESGRYVEMRPDFFYPEQVRTRVGKPGQYKYERIEDRGVEEWFKGILKMHSERAYDHYKEALDYGVAPEQARLFLPLNLYTEFRWTCNARSLMNFLALRNDPPAMQEIRDYAQTIEKIFEEKMPWVHQCFEEAGRVAP